MPGEEAVSTKIYNAYKFNGSMTNLLDHCKKFRKTWREFQVSRIVELKPSYKSVHDLYDQIRHQTTKFHPNWFDELDVRGSVVAYPAGDLILVQVFLDCEGAPDFAEDKQLFEDFHYQDQCDPPYALEDEYEDLPESEKKLLDLNWDIRKSIWGRIFSEHSSPSEAGFVYEMISWFDVHCIAGDVVAALGITAPSSQLPTDSPNADPGAHTP